MEGLGIANIVITSFVLIYLLYALARTYTIRNKYLYFNILMVVLSLLNIILNAIREAGEEYASFYWLLLAILVGYVTYSGYQAGGFMVEDALFVCLCLLYVAMFIVNVVASVENDV